MTGHLNDAQMDAVLSNKLIGRIGCGMNERYYIFPVTYVFHNGFIYVHSKEGLKLKILRQDPNVCFQVDDIENMTNWRSVLVWGKFEELKKEEEQAAALHLLRDRFAPFAISETVLPDITEGHNLFPKGLRAVAYRIRILEKSGRYEKS